MDNKLSELSKPEQFDAEIEIHDGEPFAVWAPAVNGSHVKAEHYFALLVELEAKDKVLEESRETTRIVSEEWQKDKARIAELEAKLARFGDVRQHYQAGYDDGHSRGLNAGRLYKEDTGMVMHRHASANAYVAEGGGQ
ncbi:hypothetical protein ACWASV_000517 [Serratia marcescens]